MNPSEALVGVYAREKLAILKSGVLVKLKLSQHTMSSWFIKTPSGNNAPTLNPVPAAAPKLASAILSVKLVVVLSLTVVNKKYVAPPAIVR